MRAALQRWKSWTGRQCCACAAGTAACQTGTSVFPIWYSPAGALHRLAKACSPVPFPSGRPPAEGHPCTSAQARLACSRCHNGILHKICSSARPGGRAVCFSSCRGGSIHQTRPAAGALGVCLREQKCKKAPGEEVGISRRRGAAGGAGRWGGSCVRRMCWRTSLPLLFLTLSCRS